MVRVPFLETLLDGKERFQNSSRGKQIKTYYACGGEGSPVRLDLYAKRGTCLKENWAFKTKIQLACEQIEARA